jgi:cytochrome P450
MNALKPDPIRFEYHDKIDIHSPEFVLNPYPAYAALREKCPVVHSGLYGGFWMLTRYEDVKQAAIDWHTYTSSVPGVTAIPVINPRTEPMLPIELDPPQHSKYRALVQPVFSSARIAAIRPTVQSIAEELIQKLAAAGGGDLIAGYAEPLSLLTLAAVTGLPVNDAPLWQGWIRRMFNVHDLDGRDRASQEMGEYIRGLISTRRQHPCGDFISLLMESELEGERLTDGDIYSFCTVLFGAGFETTADGMGMMLFYLAENPQDYGLLKRQPELIPTAVEEFLRYITPIQIFGRNTTHDVTLHGETIPSGEIVALAFGSANYDPEIFPDPERCVLDRAPNRHLAFGAGPHLCLGAAVARLEMAVTLEVLTRTINTLSMVPGKSADLKTRGDRRGLATLNIRIDQD